MTGDDWQLIGFSARMAVGSTVLILPLGVALAWLLARRQWQGKTLVETLVSLPMVLPPVVTGLVQIARTLGAGEWRVLFTVTLPLARRGILAGVLLAFARALGEFGATIMVAGNIPGRTTTLPVAIYSLVENGEDAHAWVLAGISTLMAFLALWAGRALQRRRP